MASWAAWYEQYTSKTIFGEGVAWPSPEVRKQGTTEHLQWITRVKRMVFPKDRQVVNQAMEECWKENNWILPSGYLPSVMNVPAGYKSFWKYDKPQPAPLTGAWNMSFEWLQQHFQPHVAGSQVLPLDVVIREMDMNTSPGYPWNMTYPTKVEFLNDERMAHVLVDYLNLVQDTFPCAIQPIWTCSVKADEMRPREKIEVNSLRTFTASPFEHSSVLNVFCLDMNTKFYKSHGDHWSFVGSSMMHRAWDTLARGLLRFLNIYSLDGNQYDSSLFVAALWDQCRLRFLMLEPQYRTRRVWNALRNLYAAIIYAVCVLDLGDLIRKFTGNPSGCANTIVDNTMVLIRMMMYAWIVLSAPLRKEFVRVVERARAGHVDDEHYVSGPENYGYSCMMKNVFMAGNGDDDVFSVSDACSTWFNAKSIAEVWLRDFNLKTTSDSWDTTTLESVSFLSHWFVVKAGLYLPSPEPEKVLSSLYRGSKSNDIRWHLLRAYALRITSWANDECRLKIETLIIFINNRYRNQLVGTISGISMVDIHSLWKSNAALWQLYTGQESAGLYETSVSLNHMGSFSFPVWSLDQAMASVQVSTNQKNGKGKVWQKKKPETSVTVKTPAKPAPAAKPATVHVNVAANVKPKSKGAKPHSVPKHIYMDPVVLRAAKAWILHMGDPFNYPPVSIGGSGTPNFLWGSYGFMGGIAQLASSTDFAASVLPSCINNTSSNTPFYTYQSTGSATSWSTPLGGYWANAANAANVVGLARPISAAVRLTFKFNQTAIPPQMYAGQIPSTSGFSVASFLTNPGNLYMSPTNVKAGPNTTSIQCCWVPQDANDVIAFTTGLVSGYLTTTTMPYVGATELLASYVYTVSVECISFYEFQANSQSQLQYYMPSVQAPYSSTELWEAYLRLTNTKTGGMRVRRVIENPRVRGHKHGNKYGLSAKGQEDDAKRAHVVNPMPDMPAEVGGNRVDGMSSNLSGAVKLGIAAAVTAAAHGVRHFNAAVGPAHVAVPWNPAPDVACVGCGVLTSNGELCADCREVIQDHRRQIKVSEPDSESSSPFTMVTSERIVTSKTVPSLHHE